MAAPTTRSEEQHAQIVHSVGMDGDPGLRLFVWKGARRLNKGVLPLTGSDICSSSNVVEQKSEWDSVICVN